MTNERGEVGQIRWTLTRLGLAIFFTMNVMLFAMALWARDLFPAPPGNETTLADAWDDLFRALCLLFASPVMVLLGFPLLDEVLAQLRRRQVTTDLLLIIGVAAAFTASLISYFRGSGHVYFEVSCMVLVAVTLGRWLEAVGKHKTTESLISLESLMPDRVTRIVGETTESVAPSEIQPGDRLLVRAGERMSVDGVVRHGSAAVDCQLITGESEPIVVRPGFPITAGMTDLDGELTIEATSSGEDGTLALLIRRVREATAAKDGYRKLADRIAAWFLPVVFLGSVAVFAWHARHSGMQSGLQAGLAVILISCPCALGLATPLAVATAIGTAARHQVLFRDGDTIARLAAIRAAAFDKTGTLTTGTCRVASLKLAKQVSIEEVVESVAPLVEHSRHPHSLAIHQFLGQSRAADQRAFRSVRQLPGRGLVGEHPDGAMIRLGRLDWLLQSGMSLEDELRNDVETALRAGWTATAVAWGGRIRAVFLLREEPRSDVAKMLEQMLRLGVTPFVLTGDDAVRAKQTCGEWGVPVLAELLPEDKAQAVEEARARYGAVAMIGDGLNDTIALATADVGIALQAASDLARQTAEVCILGNDLTRIPFAVSLARATERAIRANLVWAFAYNTVGIGLAATGILHPIVAAVAMLSSSLSVIGRSLALSRMTPAAQESADTGQEEVASAQSPLLAGAFPKVEATSSRPEVVT